MGAIYAGADLLVCRAGATTIAEVTARGLPAILVPYPYATDNHQEKNARSLESQGAAKVILDKDLTGTALHEAVDPLISNPDELAAMARASSSFGRPHAAEALADLVFEVAEKVTKNVEV
jgi:UDP-N-acetylglucosamine--N-acetylmuramyl-(pentapeptide) pyrophosphoryl-undecaprenol N-acetylglucosamine transferase